jgi:hypothetical protein
VKVTRLEAHARSFALDFEVLCRQGEIQFAWQGRIRGDERGSVRYEFDGRALTEFLKNRIGLCVLHPLAECAGAACAVRHPDGRLEAGVFPRFISPHQPFKAIEAITHEVAPGTQAEVRFHGDTFEMEDQRNWSDASFKTYSTPLELPFPARIEAGTRVTQSVTLTLLGRLAPPVRISLRVGTELTVQWSQARPRPPLGLQVASHGQALAADEIQRLEQLQLSHLRVDLDLGGEDWREQLHQATDQSRLLGTHLHVALNLSEGAEAELAALHGAWAELRPPVSLWLLFPPPGPKAAGEWLAGIRRALARFDARIPIAAGSNANFAELNRNRPPPAWEGLPCFPLNPQVHAFDDTTCMENLEAQTAVIESLRQFSTQPVVVSPITLRRRPRGARAGPGLEAPGALPRQVDPRQLSLCGAAWTLGSLAALSPMPGIHSLTYYETTGWLGVLETAAGSPLPAVFPSLPGGVFPLYHVFAQLARFPRVVPVLCSRPPTAAGLALIDPPHRRRVLVANLLSEPQTVRLVAGGEHAHLRCLDDTGVEAAMESPEDFLVRAPRLLFSRQGLFELELRPYAIAMLDLASGAATDENPAAESSK